MKKEFSEKELYKSPACRVFALHLSRVIATSTGETYNEPTSWENKDSWE